MATVTQLEEKLNALLTKVDGLYSIYGTLQQDTNSRVRLSDLTTSEDNMTTILNSQGQSIADIEKKLAKILLPEDTRYYLEEGEVGDFKSNFAKLKAMLAKFEALYKNLVAYSVSRTNS